MCVTLLGCLLLLHTEQQLSWEHGCQRKTHIVNIKHTPSSHADNFSCVVLLGFVFCFFYICFSQLFFFCLSLSFKQLLSNDRSLFSFWKRNDHLLNAAVTFNIVVLKKGHALDINPQNQYHPAAARRAGFTGDRSHKLVTWLHRNSVLFVILVSAPEEKGYG